jgi:cell division transport system permease protein
MNAWFIQHRAALAAAFRRLWATPLNTLLSLIVIGIALTLPAFGYVALDNLRDLGRNASGVQQISLFMSLEASRKDVGEIESRLRQAANGKWKFVPKEDALKRMQSSEGMAEIVASLPRNPLPDAFIVEPANTEPEALEILRTWGWVGMGVIAASGADSAWLNLRAPSTQAVIAVAPEED